MYNVHTFDGQRTPPGPGLAYLGLYLTCRQTVVFPAKFVASTWSTLQQLVTFHSNLTNENGNYIFFWGRCCHLMSCFFLLVNYTFHKTTSVWRVFLFSFPGVSSWKRDLKHIHGLVHKLWTTTSDDWTCSSWLKYRKVASSIPVYYSILTIFGVLLTETCY